MKKYILKKDDFQGPLGGRYSFFSSNSSLAGFIGIFLTDSYYEVRTKEWFENKFCKEAGSEMIDLDKRENLIVFSSPYDESKPKLEFAVTRETFSKILDEWNAARDAEKEFIVIEVSDGNDVHIYGTDKINLSS